MFKRLAIVLLLAALPCLEPAIAQVYPSGACGSAAKPFAISAAGNTIVLPAVAGTNYHLCVVDYSLAAAESVKFLITGGADITGVYVNSLAQIHDFQGFAVGLGNGVSINVSGVTTGGGTLNYYATLQNQ